jgi:iron complex outermembrane recepter protein
MGKLSSVRSLVKRCTITLSACVCIAAVEMPVIAQQASTPTATSESTLQEVIVTGSRIPVPANISATSPIATVSSQDIKLGGYTDSTDIINSLPQNIINSANDFGNTSSPLTATGGIATVDLRGLGPQRTLVLVNGRRLGVGDPSTANPNPAPDIDQVPAPLIERIDVVTGGASATYGSDAIAGVVNFIMRRDFQGIEIGGQYGTFDHNNHNGYLQSVVATPDPNTGWGGTTPQTGSIQDGNRHDLSLIMGSNFAEGNGNVTGFFVYHDQAAVPGSQRDYSGCELVSNGLIATPVTNGVECLGSSNSNFFSPTTPAPGFATAPFTVVGHSLLPWPQAGSSPPAEFNFNDYEYLQREDKRYNAGFFAHDDITDNVKPYVEFSFMNDQTTAQVAPSGLFRGGNPYTLDSNYLVNCSNPLLSAQEQGLLCTPAQIAGDKANPGSPGNSADVEIGRRNIEGGGRLSEYQHTNFRIVGGIQGDIADGWTYDTYGSYYYVTAFASNLNYLSYANIDNALQATTKNGVPVCISGGHCVPYNIFQTGGVTPAQLAYLETPGTSDGNNTETIAHADATGDLGKYGLTSPLAHTGLAINVGAEYRKESVTFAPDAAELSGDLAGFSGASVPTNASYDVSEAFFEVRAPIAQDLPGIYDLTTDAGYRYSNYNPQGVTNTYKFEVQYAPLKDGRMRFSFDRAVRAPNLIELFNAPSIGQETSVGIDPCAPVFNGAAGYTPASASLEECAHSGVSAAQYGNGATVTGKGPYTGTIQQCVAGQCAQVIEGNSELRPEVATTWSLGFTITPEALPNFSASIDYYHIHLEGVVGAVPYGILLDGCLSSGNPFYCSQVVRNETGSITGSTVAGGGYVLQKDFNLGTSLVSGVDLIVNYRWEIPRNLGHLEVSLNGAYLDHSTTTPYQGSPSFDCAGLFGATCATGLSGNVNPTWRHNMRFTWQTPWDADLSLNWRFIGPTSFDNNSTNPLLAGVEEAGCVAGAPCYDPYNARIPGYSYIDLSALWHVNQHLELRAGCNNLLDKDPPVIPSADISGDAGPANSFNTYDTLGRDIYVAFTAKF